MGVMEILKKFLKYLSSFGFFQLSSTISSADLILIQSNTFEKFIPKITAENLGGNLLELAYKIHKFLPDNNTMNYIQTH